MSSVGPKKIWIDLDNSPHVPFFLPIIDRLERIGFQVLLTARDTYQVRELLHLHGLTPRVKVIGKHWGRRRALKIIGTLSRVAQLIPWALLKRPELAIAHGSRAQILSSFILRIPCIQMFDYEFTSGAGGVKPDWVFAPSLIPESTVARMGHRFMRYPGLKEDVYIQRLNQDPSLKVKLGMRDTDLVVIVRPPATEAHYHNAQAEILLDGVLEFLTKQPGLRVVLLPRSSSQANNLWAQWGEWIENGKIMIPDHAVDGLNLMWLSDLVISGGGTMNREAAALGVPVYSIFRGEIGAVDQYLSHMGRLTLLTSVEDIHRKIKIEKRTNYPVESTGSDTALDCIVNAIVSIAEHGSLQTSH